MCTIASFAEYGSEVPFEMERKCFVLLSQSPVFAEPRAIDDKSGTFIARVKADITHGQTQETAAIFSDYDISDLDAQNRLSQCGSLDFEFALPSLQFVVQILPRFARRSKRTSWPNHILSASASV